METLSTLRSLYEGIHWSPADFPDKGPVMRIFVVSLLLAIKQIFELPVIWDAIALMWRSCIVQYLNYFYIFHIDIPFHSFWSLEDIVL